MLADLQRALDWLRPKLREAPEVALILGSGLGALAESVTEAVEVPVREIPGYPTPTVSGHAGRLVFGRLEECRVVVLQGRLHCYEATRRRPLRFRFGWCTRWAPDA